MKKILLVILGMFLLGFALNEIAGVKFPIGSTMLHDSTSVFTVNNNVKVNGDIVSNYSQVGANSPTYTIKEIRYKLGSSTNSGYTFAHGVSDIKKIHGWTCIVTDDSALYSYAPLSWYAPFAYYAKLTNTNVQVTLPVGATGLLSDSAFFTLRINK